MQAAMQGALDAWVAVHDTKNSSGHAASSKDACKLVSAG
jgi:hypothetical protein